MSVELIEPFTLVVPAGRAKPGVTFGKSDGAGLVPSVIMLLKATPPVAHVRQVVASSVLASLCKGFASLLFDVFCKVPPSAGPIVHLCWFAAQK